MRKYSNMKTRNPGEPAGTAGHGDCGPTVAHSDKMQLNVKSVAILGVLNSEEDPGTASTLAVAGGFPSRCRLMRTNEARLLGTKCDCSFMPGGIIVMRLLP